ncbi:tRNA (guanosine(46)-N7)-methyltransferase TrmB [Lachnospiraceae bacterium]|jgi:tRNA (guanine-N7-)-methyltransferase|nr:tRNA (guanosine(46)-N7)-methyltransferase TrmB [Ruminococcus sp.]NBI58128.1 tRNA (guanosine(46)-N7)-methyltransferase TrmB [Lachnospiraceae bacterium]
MRLRNIPCADSVVQSHGAVIMDAKSQRGGWKQVFGNDRPIRIEIGMGKGQFLLQMAAEHPEVNYIGMERYSSVLLRALEKYDRYGSDGPDKDRQELGGDRKNTHSLENIRFLCMDACELEQVFIPGEVDRIYLNFSDPWPKARHARRRLTSSGFLERYARVLAPGGELEFKTDNRDLFDFSLAQVEETAGWTMKMYTRDLHHDAVMKTGNIMTEYEEKFSAMGNPIFKFTAIKS